MMLDDCWRRIGVDGDGSCAELAAVVHCRNCAVYARAGRSLLEEIPPPDYLERWGDTIATAPEVEETDVLSALLFRLGAERFALPTADFVEAVEVRPVQRVPHRSGAVFLGLTNIRGELQLCVSLAALLATEPAAATGALHALPRLAVIERDGERWVFPADELLGVHRIARRTLAPPPATVARDAQALTAALFIRGDTRVALLDSERLFARLRREMT